MQHSFYKFKRPNVNIGGLLVLLSALASSLVGCESIPKEDADDQTRQGGSSQQNAGPASVDVGTARSAPLSGGLEYVGTTQPYRQISLRTQVEGQLLRLSVDVGDAVKQGQVLAQIDGKVLETAVIEATAEVAALESEVAQARAQVSDALRQVESARLQLQQAQADSVRLDKQAVSGWGDRPAAGRASPHRGRYCSTSISLSPRSSAHTSTGGQCSPATSECPRSRHCPRARASILHNAHVPSDRRCVRACFRTRKLGTGRQ
jgi:hypothetical protein